MIELSSGNLLEAEADALVNTVNCVGVMGKGIALQFRQAFPENYRLYAQACRRGEVQPGRMFVVPTGSLVSPKYIINFPTKRHWKGKARLDYIRTGLKALVAEVRRLGIRSIAIPPLGCGSGVLDWAQVRPLIEAAFAEVPDVHVFLFPPEGAPRADAMLVGTREPEMTRARALLLRLLDLYNIPGYRLTLLEVQKLAYLLQAAGEPLRLNFVRNKYGPYAENLHHVLQRMESHFIRGYGDRSTKAQIVLLPAGKKAAEAMLAGDPEAGARLGQVSRLIEGFESPYGLELLTGVHWISQEDPAAATDPARAIADVHAWSARKHVRFPAEHIRKAWTRLRNQEMLSAPASSVA